MDILKEIVSLVLENYFGWNEYEIAELWRAYPGRRRSIIRQLGSTLPDILPRIFTKRSIIREIGSRLPLPPVKRPCFKIASNVYGNPDSTNLQDGETNWIFGPEYFEDSFSYVGLEEDPSDKLSLCEDLHSIDITNDQKQPELLNILPSSTPDTVMDNQRAMKKISALEDELNKLRAQIASLVVPQSANQSELNAIPMTSTPCTPVIPPTPPCMFAPPPPPLPPTLSLTPVKSVANVIKENRARRQTISGVPADKPSNVPCMSDVLKGLSSVKLRSIERSPGGTPLRTKPLDEEGTDPSSIIAKALKKKFAQRRQLRDADSPSFDKENISSFSPSPAKSPKPLFGSHRGRKPGSDLNERVLQTSPLVNMKA